MSWISLSEIWKRSVEDLLKLVLLVEKAAMHITANDAFNMLDMETLGNPCT